MERRKDQSAQLPSRQFNARKPGRLEKKRGYRLIAMLDLIVNEPKKWPAPRLALKFGVSKETIRKDIEELRRWGHPICASWHGYYLE